MENAAEQTITTTAQNNRWPLVFRNTVYILAALFIFLFALDLLISSLEHVGKGVAETIILATSNPFTGLFIGLLVTAIIQSSSATTAMVVALTASGAITLEGAVPVIMGANIGTTITSALVSLGFITRKKEFRRAVAAGTYHSFFNLLTAVVLFPLEYYYGFLSSASQYLATTFFNEPIGPMKTGFSFLGGGFRPIIHFLITRIDNGFVLITLAVILIFGSIVFFRKVLSKVLGFGSPERFQRFFFRSPLKSLAWGVLTTAAIRSSTITTSLVVPLVAKKVVKLKSAVPFILGANVGTTITAFIAAMFNSNAAISIAIAHFLFNFIGVLIFFLIPYIKDVPLKLAVGLGSLTRKYRIIGFAYLLFTFFIIPFTLIYFNRNNIVVRELIYERNDLVRHQKTSIRVISRTMKNQNPVSWAPADTKAGNANPEQMLYGYRKNNLLLVDNKLFEFNPPGFCRSGRDAGGEYNQCVRDFIPLLAWQGIPMDSVYVFERSPIPAAADSCTTWYFVNSHDNLILKKEKRSKSGEILAFDELTRIERR